MPRFCRNPYFRPDYRSDPPDGAARGVHRRLPGYRVTPLRPLRAAAKRLGVGEVWIKDESARLGLPAYKVLGAAWATYRVIAARLGEPPEPWRDVGELRGRTARLGPLRLVTATDGNHGRGVARVARWLGWGAEIYLPLGTAAARLEGIRAEGARVVEVPGTYDEAVAAAARAGAAGDAILIQDHGWPGYEEIPGWVADGYETIFTEVDEALAGGGSAPLDAVLVQIGVGTLASAVVRHYRRPALDRRPVLVGVEPTGAACVLWSIEAGEPVLRPVGADASIMAGLNCGTPSTAAWPAMRDGMEAVVAVEDDDAREAMRELGAQEVEAGESGAAGLAGLSRLMSPSWEEARAALGLGAETRVLLLNTEGATDPANWARVVGRAPRAASAESRP